MSYDDWSSRNLRRKYLQAVKKVWRLQRGGLDVSARKVLRSDVSNYAEELRRRGWMV